MIRATTNILAEYPGASAALAAGILALAVFGAPGAYAAVFSVYAARRRVSS